MARETLQLGYVIDWDGQLNVVECIEGDWAVWYSKHKLKYKIARCNIHNYGSIRLVRRNGKAFHDVGPV